MTKFWRFALKTLRRMFNVGQHIEESISRLSVQKSLFPLNLYKNSVRRAWLRDNFCLNSYFSRYGRNIDDIFNRTIHFYVYDFVFNFQTYSIYNMTFNWTLVRVFVLPECNVLDTRGHLKVILLKVIAYTSISVIIIYKEIYMQWIHTLHLLFIGNIFQHLL